MGRFLAIFAHFRPMIAPTVKREIFLSKDFRRKNMKTLTSRRPASHPHRAGQISIKSSDNDYPCQPVKVYFIPKHVVVQHDYNRVGGFLKDLLRLIPVYPILYLLAPFRPF